MDTTKNTNKKERIFISFNQQQYDRFTDNLNTLSASLSSINNVLDQVVPVKLTAEIALEIQAKGEIYIKQLIINEKQTHKANGFSPSMSLVAIEKLEDALTEGVLPHIPTVQSLGQYLKYFSFYKKGDPYLKEEAVNEIREMHTVYANKPETVALYKLHQEACDKINQVVYEAQKLLGVRPGVIAPLHTYFKEGANGFEITELPY